MQRSKTKKASEEDMQVMPQIQDCKRILTFNRPMINWCLCNQAQHLRGYPLPKDNLGIKQRDSSNNQNHYSTSGKQYQPSNSKSRDVLRKIRKANTCSGIWYDFIFAFISMLNICKWSWVVPGSWALKESHNSSAKGTNLDKSPCNHIQIVAQGRGGEWYKQLKDKNMI